MALHMHAGDGNVHTNIPVNSDDYEMLQTATAAVARIMGIARSAGRRDIRRARHRHHQARVPRRGRDREFRAYKHARRPGRAFQPGQAPAGRQISRNAYTPSFNLLGHESLIMQQSDIGTISDSIKDCLRCGKCKPVCATHVPRANLLYSPAQQDPGDLASDRGVPLRGADAPRREHPALGRVRRRRPTTARCATSAPAPARSTSTSATYRWPCATCCAGWARSASIRARRRPCSSSTRPNPQDHPPRAQADDRVGLQGAARGARLAAERGCGRRRAGRRPPRASPPMREQVMHFVNKRMPGGLPKKTARALLDIENAAYVPIIRDPRQRQRRHRGGVLLPGLRLGAAVLPGGNRHPGDAVARRRANRAAAGVSVLRLSAARRRSARSRRTRS